MQDIHLRRIDLNLLVVLRALLAERHVTRASQQLNMTQPAVSHALNRLRAVFKDPLLIRSRGSMQLTSRAIELANKLNVILQDVSQLLVPRDFDPSQAKERLRISATEGAIVAIMLECLAKISRLAPGIEIEISSEMTQTYHRLRSAEIDVALDVFSDMPPTGFCHQPLFSNFLVCVTRKTRDQKRGQISLKDYRSAKHAQIIGGTNIMIEKSLSEVGIKRTIGLSLPGYVTAAAITAKSELVLTLPEMLAKRAAEMFPLNIRRLPVTLPQVTLSLIWHERRNADVIHKWVRQEIISATSKVPRREGRRS
jgi:DNA-binding transcriptional LysR family regulator